MTEAAIITIVSSCLSAIVPTIAALAAFNQSKKNATKQGETAKVVETIHTLTNSAMSLQKKSLAEVTAAKAAITNDPSDRLAASEAMTDYLAHMTKQASVDAKVESK